MVEKPCRAPCRPRTELHRGRFHPLFPLFYPARLRTAAMGDSGDIRDHRTVIRIYPGAGKVAALHAVGLLDHTGTRGTHPHRNDLQPVGDQVPRYSTIVRHMHNWPIRPKDGRSSSTAVTRPLPNIIFTLEARATRNPWSLTAPATTSSATTTPGWRAGPSSPKYWTVRPEHRR